MAEACAHISSVREKTYRDTCPSHPVRRSQAPAPQQQALTWQELLAIEDFMDHARLQRSDGLLQLASKSCMHLPSHMSSQVVLKPAASSAG